MSDRRVIIKNVFRVISIIVLECSIFRKESADVICTAIAVTCLAVYLLPWLLTSLVFIIFKVKDDYGGTLQYDDSDPTDCRFRMIFNFEPEELAQRDEFVIKTEKANLTNYQHIEQVKRDENKY